MSRHRLVKGLDLEDELTDFAGGDGDYEDGADTGMCIQDGQHCSSMGTNTVIEMTEEEKGMQNSTILECIMYAVFTS